MFTPPYIPPTPPKPEEEKAIFRNGLNIFMNGIYTGIGHTLSTTFNIGAIYMTAQEPKAGLSLIIAQGTIVTIICQSANWVTHEVASESTERNKTAKKQKINYKNAIENKDTNLVYKLEEENPYLIKWGKRFIKNYQTIKPQQYKLKFEE